MKECNNKKRLEIRLDPETSELIDTLIARTNLTKSSLIKTALKVYASSLKKGHIITIRYKAIEEDVRKNLIEDPIDKMEWDEIVDDIDK